ncbi:NmrA family NAD(P)-binding protein [Nonomuraea fuscirosea]|uniref:NmrA family NAD(P)-binding protein n=1 Tax=Nonomuraea fuscirosea TaxID=1291556 RepID=UPI0033FD870E
MIVVTGATGSIGRALLMGLSGHEVLSAVRRPADDLGSPYALADLDDPATIGALLSPGDRLFLNSSLWPGVVDAHRAVIDLAAEAGVAQIVTVSVRDAAPGGRLGLGMHGLIDAHLRQSGVPWAVLQPSGFMQNLPGDFDGGTMYGAYGPGRISYVDARDIADVAAALLTSPVGPGRAYVLTGPEALSHAEIAAEVGKALGRTARYVDLPVPELAARLERQGLPQPLALDLAELQAQTGDGSWAPVTTTVRDVTGRAPRTLADFLADHAAASS